MREIAIIRIVRFTLFGSLIALMLVGCGGSNSVTVDTPEPVPTVRTLLFLTPGAVTAPTPSAPGSGGSGTGSVMGDPMGNDLFAMGEKIFIEGTDKQNQIGCQYCHAEDGRGNIGPSIIGKTPGDIQSALINNDVMTFLRLNEQEVNAVAEYLKWLAEQP